MSIIQSLKNDALVYQENGYKTRWLDALGTDVIKYLSRPGIAIDASSEPAEWKNDETGSNTIVNHTTRGKWLLITTGGTEYNGINMQLHGSAFQVEAGKPFYFGIKCATENAAKGDFLIGLCEVDTTCLATSGAHALSVTDDGIYFYHLNDETDVTFVNELDGVEGPVAVGTTHDTDYHVYEIYYNGESIKAYYDNALVAEITSGLAAVALTPTINVRAGDDGAEIFDVEWLRCIQI